MRIVRPGTVREFLPTAKNFIRNGTPIREARPCEEKLQRDFGLAEFVAGILFKNCLVFLSAGTEHRKNFRYYDFVFHFMSRQERGRTDR